MARSFSTLICSLLCSFLLTSLPARADVIEPSAVKLLANQDGFHAGQSFMVGAYFSMQPGWHIYWKIPGDAGLPTKINFILPEGVSAGELEWPEHEEFVQAGGIKSNGYSGSVLLAAPITVPPTYNAESLPIEAKISWLDCSADLCVPGKVTLKLDLFRSSTPKAANEEIFKVRR